MVLARRTFLMGTVWASAAVALAGCGDDSNPDQPEPRGYDGDRRALPIPALDDGDMSGESRVFSLTATEVNAEILPGTLTSAWGFNGSHLGPTLHLHRDENVAIRVTNGLPDMTTIHWHGAKLPAAADGGPHLPIGPGETWEASWEVEQPAASLWYHPHPHEATALHAYRGLAGLIIIDDETSEAVDLPHDYGIDDIPVVIMDQKFNADGTLNEESDPDLGLKGDTPTLNGITNAQFDATTRRVRFRILDAATMRFFHLRFSDGRSFHVVATDCGLLAEPKEVESVMVSPGERVEIVVDLDEEEDVMLQAVPFPDNFGVPEDEYSLDFGLRDRFDLLRVRGPVAGAGEEEPAALPETLDASAAEIPDIGGATEREFTLDTFQINGKYMDMGRVDFTIEKDTPEVWTVTNGNSDWVHNFHVHDAAFRVLEVSGTDQEIASDGWKDTVALPPNATVRLAVTFGYYPDNTLPYMYHCHMLLHEDEGMMGQFLVVEPGQEPDLAVLGHSH